MAILQTQTYKLQHSDNIFISVEIIILRFYHLYQLIAGRDSNRCVSIEDLVKHKDINFTLLCTTYVNTSCGH